VRRPKEEPLLFLDAMESDLSVNRYATYEDLRKYMRGSAAAVGMMMCSVLSATCSEEIHEAAKALGEAMQLTNFLRDVGEDAGRNRVYLPKEDLDAYGVAYEDIFEANLSESFKNLMRFQIQRARALYEVADHGIQKLPETAKPSVYIARVLYSRILDRIEGRDFDVYSSRARTSKLEKIAVASRVLVRGIPISSAIPPNWEHRGDEDC
jgi:phytoene synthase